MTVTATCDATKTMAKLEELQKTIAALTGARGIITPTQVIYYHCVDRNEKLLDKMPASAHQDCERRWRPKVEEASKASVRAITGKQSLKSYEEAIARAWRYGAYLIIDRLWAEAKSGAWGRVKRQTESRKVAEVQEAWGRQDDAAVVRGRSVRVRTSGAIGWVVNYGVRQIEAGRRWYDVQKGRRRSGQRTDGDLIQQPPVIEVKIGSKTISSV